LARPVLRSVTDDGVRNDLKFAGFESVGQDAIDGAGALTGGDARFGGGDATLLGRVDEALDGFGIWRSVFNKDAVGQLRETFATAGDTEHGFDLVIVRRKIVVFNGPVLTEAVVVFTFEFVVTQTPGSAPPEVSFAANETDANPVIWIVFRIGVWILLLVSPDVFGVLVGLCDVRETAGCAEAAIGKGINLFEFAMARVIETGAGVEHETVNSLTRELARSGGAGGSGTDDEYVVSSLCHMAR